jgi:predicted TIM-barrel fold metal-dependent hydrolase
LEKFSEPAINIYPGCHGCSLLSEETGKLSEIIQKENKTLIVTIRIEDSRASNPYCRFPEVSIEEIKQFLKIFPKIKIIFLNACWGEIKEIAETENDNFLADIAFAERLETLDTLLELISPKQLIFGSNTPLFYIESAKAKILRASSSEEIKNRIAYKNLMELFNEKA